MVEIPLYRDEERESILEAEEGERLSSVLLNAHVPPVSVVLTADGEPVSENHRVDPAKEYEAWVTAGYEIELARRLYSQPAPDSVYTYRRLSFGENGQINMKSENFDLAELESHVERTLRETIEHYGLIEKGDTVLVALSGGVDSAALLYGLDAVRSELPSFDIIAVTIEEPWPETGDEHVEYAGSVADDLGVEHSVIGLDEAKDVFDLSEPVPEVVERLEETQYSEQTVAVIDHILTRMVERYAQQVAADKISLGVHATELIAGLLTADITGYDVSNPPRQTFESFAYVYPLSLVTKRELVLYNYACSGDLLTSGTDASWNYAAEDQSYYSFLADLVLWYWPGLQYWLVETHRRDSEDETFDSCDNCGKVLPRENLNRGGRGLCAACELLSTLGLVDS